MNKEAKKRLDQISEDCARDIIKNNDDIKEWVKSQQDPNTTTTQTRNTGSKDTSPKKTND